MDDARASSPLKALYDDSLVWDAHAGIFPDPGVDLAILDSWRVNGVDYLSINVGFDVLDPGRTMATLASYRRQVFADAERLVLAGRVADIERARREGKLAISFDIEGMNALSDSLDMLDLYHALGVRQMLFAYNLNNAASSGCHDEDRGLTAFGRAIVRRMNDLGIIVDCSHAGCRSTMDMIAESRKPVVFSHSNPASVWAHGRNITDEQIKACAATGGVIGMNGMGIFLGPNDTRSETILRHVRHVADLVGPAHVGFGFDYSPPIGIEVSEILKSRPDYWPPGNLYDTPHVGHAGPPEWLGIVETLGAAGFDDGEIRGMLGENFKRVAAAVWRA